MSLKNEPASGPLHISVKQLFLDRLNQVVVFRPTKSGLVVISFQAGPPIQTNVPSTYDEKTILSLAELGFDSLFSSRRMYQLNGF